MSTTTEQRQFRAQKSALTRAINSGDPEKVIVATRKAVAEWEGWKYGWPDNWHNWNRALDDAFNVARAAYVNGQGPRPDANRFDIDQIRREVVLVA